MSASAKPIFLYRRTGLLFRVFADRVEVAERQTMTPEAVLYPLADIAQVELINEPGILRLTLRDGTWHDYQLAGNAAAARDAILRLL